MKCNRCAFRNGKPGDTFPAISPSVSRDVRMKRYFFHQRIGEELIEDFEGFEYVSAAAARASAVISARHLWAAAILAGDDLSGEAIEIVDEDGTLMMTVPLSDALPFSLACAAGDPRESRATRRAVA